MKKKNTAPVAPPRKGAPPSSNSVAAKRLAAKRGGAMPTTPSSEPLDFSANQFSSGRSGGDFAPDFGDFESTPSSYSVTPVTSTKTPGGSVRRPSNDDFFDDAPVQFNTNVSQPVASVDDFFSDSSAGVTFDHVPATSSSHRPQGKQSTSFVDFDADFNQPISVESSKAANSSFDPFNDTNEPDPFHNGHQPQKTSAASTFDAFTNDSDDFFASSNISMFNFFSSSFQVLYSLCM
jgi:hypothetical protein